MVSGGGVVCEGDVAVVVSGGGVSVAEESGVVSIGGVLLSSFSDVTDSLIGGGVASDEVSEELSVGLLSGAEVDEEKEP